jgi:ZIP family zinc transporter
MLLNLILFAAFAGLTIPVGGLLAKLFNHHVAETPVKYEITHSVMSFGAGIILAALALVLVPSGMEQLELVPLCVTFFGGAVVFYFIDSYLAKTGGQMATMLAMMMDFVPESIAMGAVFMVDPSTASLLAIIIGLQNLPEAFNAYRDLILGGGKPNKILWIFVGLSTMGVIGALIGNFALQDSPKATAYLMIFASGGILYLLVQDIIPETKLKNSGIPALAATLGFLVGVIGEKVV